MIQTRDLEREIYFAETKDDQNELDALLQEPMENCAKKWSIDITDQYWYHDPRVKRPILTDAGKNWIKREAGKLRRERAKDWIAIISPVVSGVISILGLALGLLVALMKH